MRARRTVLPKATSKAPALHALAAAALLALLPLTLLAQTHPLNDTGQISCYNDSNNAVVCDATTTGNTGTRPHQDGRYGRDVASPTKVGAGAAGFDFTKIANDGSPLLASVALGTGSGDWACTRDNVTGLTWEVKTTGGLRSSDHLYTWYFTANNGGTAGNVGTGTSCGNTLSAYSNQCNTSNYIAAINAAVLCGATDWRLPTRRELLSIVHNGLSSGPLVDATYFPNTLSNVYWSRDTSMQSTSNAWTVRFDSGVGIGTGTSSKNSSAGLFVRLVRGGQ